MISFYKAKPDISGTACSFQYQTKTESKGKVGVFYCTLLRQTDWDAQSKTGSFIGSKENPNDSCVIKFSFGEAASMISAIRRNRDFTFYHSSQNGVIKGNFRPYVVEKQVKGFSFSIDKQAQGVNERFGIGLLLGEAEQLAIYFQAFMARFYTERDEEYQKSLQGQAAPTQNNRQQQNSKPVVKETQLAENPQDDVVSSLDFSEDNTVSEDGGVDSSGSDMGW